MNPKPARFVTPASDVAQITQLPGLNMQRIRACRNACLVAIDNEQYYITSLRKFCR